MREKWPLGDVRESLVVSALTIAEIRRGILDLPPGRRRDGLEAWFVGPEGPAALFAGRILAFDERAALVWARLMAEGRALGRPRSALDTIIAATAEANGCVVVTGNEKDFGGGRGGESDGIGVRLGHCASPRAGFARNSPPVSPPQTGGDDGASFGDVGRVVWRGQTYR